MAITDNFRSRKPILGFVNQRFAAPLNSIGYEPLVCTVPYSAKDASSIARIPIGKVGAEYNVHEWRELEAQAVAQLCRQLIGEFMVRENKEQVPCRPGDIALLAPTGTDLWIYERALEDLDIPIATQAGKGFFIRQKVHDLLAIARILSNNRDTLALGAFLRGPLVGLTEQELLDITAELPLHDGEYGRLRLWTEPTQINHRLAAESLLEKAPEVIARMGITLESVVENYLIPQMNAVEVKLAQHEGKFTDSAELAAWPIQQRATRTMLELMGAFPSEDEKLGSKPNVDVIVLNMPEPPPLPPLIRKPKPENGNSPQKAVDPRDDPNYDPRPKD